MIWRWSPLRNIFYVFLMYRIVQTQDKEPIHSQRFLLLYVKENDCGTLYLSLSHFLFSWFHSLCLTLLYNIYVLKSWMYFFRHMIYINCYVKWFKYIYILQMRKYSTFFIFSNVWNQSIQIFFKMLELKLFFRFMKYFQQII